MVFRFSIILIIIISLYPLSSATIINIPVDYPTIQQGIDASADGDTVLVQPGTYYENINFNGHNIMLGSRFLTTGDTSYIAQTVIDGDSAGSVVRIENGEDSTAVITGFTILNGTSYEGGGIYCEHSIPTIRNNLIMENAASFGGGIYCEYSGVNIYSNKIIGNSARISGGGIHKRFFDPTTLSILSNTIANNEATYGGGISILGSIAIIRSNDIINNSAVNGGGGIDVGYSEGTIDSNYFAYNKASRGGAIKISSGGNIITTNNLIIYNSALTKGGGIYNSFSNTMINKNIITKNKAANSGGGIYYGHTGYPLSTLSNNIITFNETGNSGAGIFCGYYSVPRIINNIINQNSSRSVGGGICCYYYSDPVIYNNVLYNNFADSIGHTIYLDRSNPFIINSIIWSDFPADIPLIDINASSFPVINYCNISCGWQGEGNLNVNPMIRNPDNGDFHLMSIICGDSVNSPCIDAGHPDINDMELNCDRGLGLINSDMGAYGGGVWGQVNVEETKDQVPEHFLLLQNYPNPFNAQTTIRFILPKSQDLKLTLYDLLGRQVETLIDEYMQAGVHTLTFDASDFPSGVYFARLKTNNATKSIKMLLLK